MRQADITDLIFPSLMGSYKSGQPVISLYDVNKAVKQVRIREDFTQE
jgi:hypothetical protein